MDIREHLGQPYPKMEDRWKIIISISCFISLFILIFQPFQLSQLQSNYRHLILIGYGGITFLALYFNILLIPAYFKNLFKEKEWTVQKQLVFFIWILFTIGLGNYFYTLSIIDSLSFNVRSLFLFQLYTLAIGIFPVVFLVIFTQNKYYKKNLASAAEVNAILSGINGFSANEQKLISFEGQGREILSLDPRSVLFIEAMGNYINIHFLQNQKHRSKMLRCSLKEAKKSIEEFPYIFKCHRAFLINLSNMESAKGNAQGYLLKIKGSNMNIPVSRSYIPELKKYLNQLRKNQPFPIHPKQPN